MQRSKADTTYSMKQADLVNNGVDITGKPNTAEEQRKINEKFDERLKKARAKFSAPPAS